MAKIPFSVEHRDKIESGEYKVETDSKEPVTIIKWDLRNDDGNIFCYYFDGREEIPYVTDGKDLFIVTPEEELTEFEKKLVEMLMEATGKPESSIKIDAVKETAAELLALAREQFIKDGYVIEKKAFRDAVEKIDDKHKADMSVEYTLHSKVENGTRHAVMNWNEFQKVAQHFIDCGKAEALKDLPRWRDDDLPKGSAMIDIGGLYGLDFIRRHRKLLRISDLEKLPGFKED